MSSSMWKISRSMHRLSRLEKTLSHLGAVNATPRCAAVIPRCVRVVARVENFRVDALNVVPEQTLSHRDAVNVLPRRRLVAPDRALVEPRIDDASIGCGQRRAETPRDLACTSSGLADRGRVPTDGPTGSRERTAMSPTTARASHRRGCQADYSVCGLNRPTREQFRKRSRCFWRNDRSKSRCSGYVRPCSW
jgi:hypothetical protein